MNFFSCMNQYNFSPLSLLIHRDYPEENQQIDEVEEFWINISKTLSEPNQIRFSPFIHTMCQRVFDQISYLSTIESASEKIKEEKQRSLLLLHTSAQRFFNQCQNYEKIKQDVNRELDDFGREVNQCHLSFSNQIEQFPFEQQIREQTNDLSFSFLGQKLGGGKIFSQIIKEKQDKDQKSIRDRVVSVGVDVYIGKLLSCLPYAKFCIPVIQIVGKNAPYLESLLDRIEITNAPYTLSPQEELSLSRAGLSTEEQFSVSDSIHASRFFIKICQATSSYLEEVSKSSKQEIEHQLDEMQITDENVVRMIEKALESNVKNDD